jgi:hypothetical protein
MQSNTEACQFSPEKRKCSTLCWAARIVPLTVAIPLVAWMFYLPLVVWNTSARGDDPVPLLLPVDLIPLAFALIAWKWHLVGGLFLTSLAILVIAVPLVLTGYDFLLILGGTVLLASGILHLIVWWAERQREDPQHI